LIQNKSVGGMGKRKKKKPDKVKACLSTGSQVKYPRQVQTNRNKRDPEENHKKKIGRQLEPKNVISFLKAYDIDAPASKTLFTVTYGLVFFRFKKERNNKIYYYNNQRETICRLICC
jgi:hypothetical protein